MFAVAIQIPNLYEVQNLNNHLNIVPHQIFDSLPKNQQGDLWGEENFQGSRAE
jgi:hypothetical protein